MYLILYLINVRSYLNRLLRRKIRSKRSTIYSSHDDIAIDCSIKLSDVIRIVITINTTLTTTNSMRFKMSSTSFISDIHDISNNDFK